MKGLFKSKLVLTLIALVLMAGAIAIPLSGSIARSHAAPPRPITITKTFQTASCSSPVKVSLLNVGDKVSGTALLTSSDPGEASQGENLLVQETLGPYTKTVIVGSGSQSISFTEITINDTLTACITGEQDTDQTATVTVTITPAPPSHPKTPIESTSDNWAGYSTFGKTYSTVEGLWIQPAITCPAFLKNALNEPASSFWVGLDGDTTNPVEQTGTDADCIAGHPIYYAWFEMYPAPPVPIQLLAPSDGISPGDRMHAKVSVGPKSIIGKETFTLEIDDLTQGWHFSTTQLEVFTKRPHKSAECIVERTQSNLHALFKKPAEPLADFGTVQFPSCLVDGVPIGTQPNLTRYTLSSLVPGHPDLVSVFDLTLGSAFSITWLHGQ